MSIVNMASAIDLSLGRLEHAYNEIGVVKGLLERHALGDEPVGEVTLDEPYCAVTDTLEVLEDALEKLRSAASECDRLKVRPVIALWEHKAANNRMSTFVDGSFPSFDDALQTINDLYFGMSNEEVANAVSGNRVWLLNTATDETLDVFDGKKRVN